MSNIQDNLLNSFELLTLVENDDCCKGKTYVEGRKLLANTGIWHGKSLVNPW